MTSLRSPIRDDDMGNCPVAGLLLLAAVGLIGPLDALPNRFFYGALIAAFALSAVGLLVLIMRAARDIRIGQANSVKRLALAQFALGALILETQFALAFGRGIAPSSPLEIAVGRIGIAILIALLAIGIWKVKAVGLVSSFFDGRLWLIILETAVLVCAIFLAPSAYSAATVIATILLWVWQAATAINFLKGRRHTAALIGLTGWIAIALLGWALAFAPPIDSFGKFDDEQRIYAEQARARISSSREWRLIAWHVVDVNISDDEAIVELRGYGWMRIPVDSAVVAEPTADRQ